MLRKPRWPDEPLGSYADCTLLPSFTWFPNCLGIFLTWGKAAVVLWSIHMSDTDIPVCVAVTTNIIITDTYCHYIAVDDPIGYHKLLLPRVLVRVCLEIRSVKLKKPFPRCLSPVSKRVLWQDFSYRNEFNLLMNVQVESVFYVIFSRRDSF